MSDSNKTTDIQLQMAASNQAQALSYGGSGSLSFASMGRVYAVSPLAEGASAYMQWNGRTWQLVGKATLEAPKACGPVCECGVKFTGGLHSTWCPCHV